MSKKKNMKDLLLYLEKAEGKMAEVQALIHKIESIGLDQKLIPRVKLLSIQKITANQILHREKKLLIEILALICLAYNKVSFPLGKSGVMLLLKSSHKFSLTDFSIEKDGDHTLSSLADIISMEMLNDFYVQTVSHMEQAIAQDHKDLAFNSQTLQALSEKLQESLDKLSKPIS
jgi:hypothetical protein